MKNITHPVLIDDEQRRLAISGYSRSLLVEAGAGSGKTAVMAGRIAMMLAEGIRPDAIAAVTFTELAAAELIWRVHEFVDALLAGSTPPELRVALPNGLSAQQRANLAIANDAIDDVTCSTIHGFCQRLIKPYPAEADIDPGASIMDRGQADLIFDELVERWLRNKLEHGQDTLLAELIFQDANRTVALVKEIAVALRHHRNMQAPGVALLAPQLQAFHHAVDRFTAFIAAAPTREIDTANRADEFSTLLVALPDDFDTITPKALVRLAGTIPGSALYTGSGTFRKLQTKAKWVAAARDAGLSVADGNLLFEQALNCYTDCCEAWELLQTNVASHIIASLIEEVHPIRQQFQDAKRASAQLDFDDLIFAARDLLRDHDAVRRSLGERFAHVLVDEFQDTDPLQTEIFWRLCGDPLNDGAAWSDYRLRPGALFLVGDPKQAIYRFRGADVSAYIRARETFHAADPKQVLSISTNFRSSAPILDFVNEHFESLLSADGQPGFTALSPFHASTGEHPHVVALDIAPDSTDGKAGAEQIRDAEAEAVAMLCRQLVGKFHIPGRHGSPGRLCQAGDIALLAPTGTDLWRYEEALERIGIAVATQAGKGFYRRQEIQDLIALTRVLADHRDTLALGALLRGPLVGLSEQELLDITWGLTQDSDDPARITGLRLMTDTSGIEHPLARDLLEKLQSLYRSRHGTTPYALLSQAVDVLRVRALLQARHQGQAERVLANVDRYLSLAIDYGVRGLRAFSDAMVTAWTDEERAIEGRPDAQEESVALFTMHASKGLEWPVVIPINTMTTLKSSGSTLVDRASNTFYCKVLGIAPAGYAEARQTEEKELDRERIRLWYVATTRARNLLILPRRADAGQTKNSWVSLVNLPLSSLPAFDSGGLPDQPAALVTEPRTNTQSRSDFAAQATRISEGRSSVTWIAPSRSESGADAASDNVIWNGQDDTAHGGPVASPTPQGGRERGLVLHKLMEEVLTGETEDNIEHLERRAEVLVLSLGQTPAADPNRGLNTQELAASVIRTLALPEVAALRHRLLSELPVYGMQPTQTLEETVVAGIADAIAVNADSDPEVVIDWKSDVRIDNDALLHYLAQVRSYLEITGAPRGLIVLMTPGRVIEVTRERSGR